MPYENEVFALIRFLHTSDWHLGRVLHGRSLIEDQEHILDSLILLIERSKPHALVISGDIFDRSTPPEAAVRLFDRFLFEVAEKREVPVLLIPGNHDSNERLGFASRLLRKRGVSIFSKVEDSFVPISIEGDGGSSARFFGIPFLEPMEIGMALGRDDIRTPDQAMSSLCRKMLEPRDGDTKSSDIKDTHLPAVLLCHAFVVGGETSESEREIYIGGSSQVTAASFEGFSYVALGHLHKPQTHKYSNGIARYSGSLLPYSKSEVGHQKSITEVQIKRDGSVTTEEHQLSMLRNLRFLEGEIDQLIEEGAKDKNSDDYVIVSYTDKGAIIDAAAKLRTVYPNLLHVGRTLSFEPENAPALSRARERENLSELDLFAQFFRESTGEDLTPEEREELVQTIGLLGRE